MLPAWSERLLPVGQASYAKNGFLFSGNLIGWRKPRFLRELDNPAARMVYRVPTVTQTQALAFLVFKLNANDGDTVLVGEQTYTFKTALTGTTGAPFEVLIGATALDTATHFKNALTADSLTNANAGTQYGQSTPFNGAVKYFLPDTDPYPGLTDPQAHTDTIAGADYAIVIVGADDFGASFNTVLVAESTAGARLTWLRDTVSFSHTTTTYAGGTNAGFDSRITAQSKWLEFEDVDTNVVRSPVANDVYNRYYFASPSQMPKYTTYERIQNSQDPWLLGVPPPGCAPVLSVTGGGNNLTLGNITNTNADVSVLGNRVFLTRITTPGATQIQDIKLGLGPNAPADGYPTAHWAGVLYADNAGAPGTLLNTGNIQTGLISTDLNTSSFLNPTNLLSDTSYWIGIMIDASVLLMGGPADGAGTHVGFPNTFSNGPPGNATGLSGSVPGIYMYADLITSDILETRSYVYTWQTAYGEEGPPSPPALLDGWSNGTWKLLLFQPPPDEVGVVRDLKKLNIYRTVPGSGGTTVFFYVDTVTIGTAEYLDTKPDNEVALNDQLETTNWFPPPANLQGLTVMQNGMLAGFVGNEIWFCEPYHPHAWPPAYALTVDYPIIGLGMTSGSLVVCTSASPYIVNGPAPSQMNQTKASDTHPCLSRGSILSSDTAVTYMSPNGLIQVTYTGATTNTTDLWITREKWQQIVPQKNTRAIMLASCYYCLGAISPDGTDTSVAQQGFTIELAQDNQGFSIWPHPGGHRLGLQLLDSPVDMNVANLLTDPWTGYGVVVSAGNVYYYDFSDEDAELQVYTYRTKFYQQNARRNYSAMKVFFTIPPGTPAQNATRLEKAADDAAWATLPADRYGYIKTYVDLGNDAGFQLIDCREIRKSGELLRIVDGFKADTYFFEIVSRVHISNVQIATSVKELAQV